MVRRGLAATALALALAACGGGGAAANGGDPVAVAQGYIDAVKVNPSGGLQFLESESTEKLTGPTSLSRYLAANKGATADILTLPWIPPGSTIASPMKKQCLVIPPQGGQLCIVTVEVKAGSKTRYFHLNLEMRYIPGVFQIINVDAVSKPDELLPNGNEAHQAYEAQMLAFIPGPELLDITTGDMIFVTIWAVTSLVIAAIYCYKMLQ